MHELQISLHEHTLLKGIAKQSLTSPVLSHDQTLAYSFLAQSLPPSSLILVHPTVGGIQIELVAKSSRTRGSVLNSVSFPFEPLCLEEASFKVQHSLVKTAPMLK
jgi:hypothetical protein